MFRTNHFARHITSTATIKRSLQQRNICYYLEALASMQALSVLFGVPTGSLEMFGCRRLVTRSLGILSEVSRPLSRVYLELSTLRRRGGGDVNFCQFCNSGLLPIHDPSGCCHPAGLRWTEGELVGHDFIYPLS